MPRLFITPRELNFLSDLTKEIVKDVIGQKIYYYPVSETKTQTHRVYNESLTKMYDNPIEIDAIVDSNYQTDTKIDRFGIDAKYKIEVYLQHRDLVDKRINVTIGDFFSFSDNFYEITEKVVIGNVYGMAEHKRGIKVVGTKARKGQFDAVVVGPTDVSRPETDAVQTTFTQQRGLDHDPQGRATGDKRDLVENGPLDPPLTSPREVSGRGDETNSGEAFYDE